MTEEKESQDEKLGRLREELKRLKARLPEHCSGREGYVGVHRSSAALWQKIEDLEDEIQTLEEGCAG